MISLFKNILLLYRNAPSSRIAGYNTRNRFYVGILLRKNVLDSHVTRKQGSPVFPNVISKST